MAEREPLLVKRKVQESRFSQAVEHSEKQDASHKPIHPVKIVVLVILGLVILTARLSFGLWKDVEPFGSPEGSPRMVDDFKNIVPNEKLKWHPCFGQLGPFQCARLTVPMDYNRPLNESEDNPKVDIALLMLPGKDHASTGRWSTSPLLLNPGGPGGSGVYFALAAGAPIQQIVGHDQDIIGFDPRGIGETTPLSDCYAFPSSNKHKEPSQADSSIGLAHRVLWMLSGLEIGLVGSSPDALAKLDVRSRVIGELCGTKDAVYGENSILRHMSTPAVAHDMLSIIDAWDSWTNATRAVEATTMRDEGAPIFRAPDETDLSTKGKLVYWGLSYGTLLGATFASIFPDRVGRLILDGVVDADFYVSPVWVESLLDTDATEASFFTHCYKAGQKCAFYRVGDGEADIRARYFGLLEHLKRNPIAGIRPVTWTPSIITYETIKGLIFQVLYSPMQLFPLMAYLLDTLDRNRDDLILSIELATAADFRFLCTGSVFPGYQAQDAQMGIMCSDKRVPLNESLPDLHNRYQGLANISHYGDIWTTLMLSCSGYPITATDPPMKWNPDPKHPSYSHHPIRTAFPLLFLSNTADPVTPLYAGVKMAKKFVNAGLVELKSEGHCSIGTPSLCLISKMRAYLCEGKVPAAPEWGPGERGLDGGKWEVCERDAWPWGVDERDEMNARGHGNGNEMSAQDVELMAAWNSIGQVAAKWPWWGRDPGAGVQVDWDVLVRRAEERRAQESI